MQYLYVLTSTPNDNYYEQFLVSAASLKYFTPNAKITLLCDTGTKKKLTEKRSEYEKLVCNIITVDVPSALSQIEVSRWIKTSMRKFVKGDFLFIDCDTVITENLSSVFNYGINFGACLDKHLLIDSHPKKNNILSCEKKLAFNSHLSNKHFNSGVLFAADTPQTHKLFNCWHELWLFCKSKNIVRDQPALNMAIYESKNENPVNFTELDGTWNCQIVYNGLPYLANSKIIHYFATDSFLHTSPYILASSSILNNITKTGFVSKEVFELIKNPKAAFAVQTRIVSGEALDVVNSSYFEFILLLKQKIPPVFNCMNGFCSFLKKIAKVFVVKKSKKKDGGIKFYN